MRRLPLLALSLFVLACGQKEESAPPAEPRAVTPFGSVADVRAYRQQIEPVIRAVGAAQAIVEQGVGTTGQATAPNLAASMSRARPGLQAAYDTFRQIEPPVRLRSLHEKIDRLMSRRLEAYALTIAADEGHAATREGETWEQHVEAQLEEANQLISQVNGELQTVDAALRAAAPPPQVATP